MQVILNRGKSTANSTPGELTAGATFNCYTLEPPEGGFDQTIIADKYGNPVPPVTTHYDRIPAGKYHLALHQSARLGYLVPWILSNDGVAAFDSRMYYDHIGNWCLNAPCPPAEIDKRTGKPQVDTDGCALLGYERGVDAVYQSTGAFRDFMALITPILKSGQVVSYTVVD